MTFYYLVNKGADNVSFVNGEFLTIGSSIFTFNETSNPDYDYKVVVTNGNQDMLDSLIASTYELVITQSTYESI
jgi:hypothetical protein